MVKACKHASGRRQTGCSNAIESLRSSSRARLGRSPRHAAKCPNGFSPEAGCWRLAAARTPPTRSTSRSSSCIPSSSASARCRRSIFLCSSVRGSTPSFSRKTSSWGSVRPKAMPRFRTLWRRPRQRGAMTFELPGGDGSYSCQPPTNDPFLHQELIEILYHTLWETVHVFFEHRELGARRGRFRFPISVSRQ